MGDKKNLDGKDNYIYMEATGRGHFVGVTHAVEQNQNDWFGEGDDMIFIDGDQLPTINGTGTEDYYNGAWAVSYTHLSPALLEAAAKNGWGHFRPETAEGTERCV